MGLHQHHQRAGETGRDTKDVNFIEFEVKFTACELTNLNERGRRSRIGDDRLRNALEEQSQGIARKLHDEAIRPLVAVHLKLAEVADNLTAPERSRLRSVSALLALFEVELRQLAAGCVLEGTEMSRS
jgi:hypothetical protein